MTQKRAFDTIIIGAGSTGAILAARLSQNTDRTILLLEAGPDYPDLASTPLEVKQGYGLKDGMRAFANHDWGYRGRASTQSASIEIPRGKITGGSSAVNGQVFLRGEPDDFARWAAAGNDQWSFDQVLPYFKKSERDLDFTDEFHGTAGPTSVQRCSRDEWLPDQVAYYDGCRTLGFPDCPDHNRPHTTGIGPLPLNCIDGIRQSTALTYLSQARQRPNLTIQPNSTVHHIRFTGRRATGVDVECQGHIEEIAGTQILLCAGAIGSPQLLMLSGVGPADHLRSLDIPVVANLPGVGQNLRDHPTVNMRWRIRADIPGLDTPKHPMHQVVLRYTAPGSELVNDMIVYVGLNIREHFLLMRPTINLAASAGELRLLSTDPTQAPALNYRYFAEPFDLARQREAVRFCITLSHTAGFEALIEDYLNLTSTDLESDAALEQWILQAADTGHHSAGTCKMGPATDAMAVADQWGRVHGVEHLCVVDASLMPDCVRANINAAVLMMGERMADQLGQG